jgi:hypothetical protein
VILTDTSARRLEGAQRHRQLMGMSDHDLLVQLHERMDNHIIEHNRNTVSNRWMIGTLVAIFGVVVLLVHL